MGSREDWKIPEPEETVVWRGRRISAWILLGGSLLLGILSGAGSFWLLSGGRAPALWGWSAMGVALLLIGVVAPRSFFWTRHEVVLTTLRAWTVKGVARRERREILIVDLTSAIVTRRSWQTWVGLADLTLRSHNDSLHVRSVGGWRKAVSLLEMMQLCGGREMEAVRAGDGAVMYVAVPAFRDREGPAHRLSAGDSDGVSASRRGDPAC